MTTSCFLQQYLSINDTKVKVRNNGYFSRSFSTNVGVAQGDINGVYRLKITLKKAQYLILAQNYTLL